CYSVNRIPLLLRCGQIGLWKRPGIGFWELPRDVDAFESSFFSAGGIEGQKVLVAKMHADFIQIRFDRDGREEAKSVAFGASFVRELTEIGLRGRGAEESARPVA